MDHLEKELENIEQFNKRAVNDYKKLLAKTFYKTAGDVSKSSKRLDKEFSHIFPETMDLGTSVDNFNPYCVVEFKDNKAIKVINEWDKDFGLLPDRKVMGSYFIDVGTTDVSKAIGFKFNGTSQTQVWDENTKSFQVLKCNGSNQNIILRSEHNGYNGSHPCKLSSGQHIFNLGTNPTVQQVQQRVQQNIDNFSKNNIKPYIDRGEIDSVIFKNQSHEFEVDNYLNLYHKPTGLYLMFNKVPFPGLPFYLNKHITQFKGKTYYPIFKSKKLEKFDFDFNKSVYDSIDSRDDFLEKINQLFPYDYDIVYDFYNRFRKMMKLDSPDDKGIGNSGHWIIRSRS